MKYLLYLLLAMSVAIASCEKCDENCPCKIKERILIDHLALKCKDVTASAKWYKKVFETTEIENKTGNPAITWLSLGDGELHLTPFRDTLPVIAHKSHHLAIANHNMEELIQRLDDMNHPWESWQGVKGEITTRHDGIRQIYFQDPDGYWIEVNDAGFEK